MWYNEYRPRNLSEVYGNDSTKADLSKRLASKSVPNVMMFVGDTGTGKTTIAAIIAASLNCHNPKRNEGGVEPCGQCDACIDVFGGHYARDVRFYDGSDLGKDAIEHIRSEVVYDPMYDEANVVIIDEAQNITQSGLEMTLRLLEVERPNTYFILCTMNPKAFGKAVRSRGQVYQFEKLPLETIGERLMDVLEAEDPEETLPDILVEEGIPAIAEAAEGSLRQGISMLERAVNSELYDRAAIEREFGVVGEKKTFALLMDLLDRKETFFQNLRQIELKSFFYYAWKVVNESAMRSFTLDNEDPDDWKVKNTRKLIRKESFWDLLDMFTELQRVQTNFFNENAFLTMLIQFFRKGEGNSEPQKVRRVKRKSA